MTQKVALDAETVRGLIDRQLQERLKVVPWNSEKFNVKTVCEVILPLHWSDGDIASVFIGERGEQTIVHDGGQIRKTLLGAQSGGLSEAEIQRIERKVTDLEIKFDRDSGIAFVETRQENLLYWLVEMGRIMTMVPHLYADPDG